MSPRLWAITAIFAAACGGKHPGTYTAAGDASGGGSAVSNLITSADAAWEGRVDEVKLKAALGAYEAVLGADPKNRHALAQLTRGWYFWGDGFTTDKDVQIERWGKAIEYGARCLAVNEKFAAAIEGGAKEKDAAAFAVKDDVPCLYWTASALGKWGKAQGISRTLKHLPTVKAYIGKVEELEPTYYNYGPARYWGAYYAALPSFAGQDLAKSAEFFEAAIQGAPYYLPTRVLRAEMLAVATENAKMFDSDLKTVLTSDPDAKPEAAITPENTRDMDKARALLAKRSELFDKKVLEEAGPAPEIPAEGARRPEPEPAPAPEPEPGPEATPTDTEAGTDTEPPTEGAKPAAEAEPKADGAAKPDPAAPATDGAKPSADGE